MGTFEGVHWSAALLVAIFLFSLVCFFRLRSRELHLARERVVFMDWDGVTSVAWTVTSAALLLASLLTYWRLNGFRGFSLSDYMRYGEASLLLSRELRNALWHLGMPILAVLCVHVWTWAGSERAWRRYRGPARNSRWLLIPIAVTAGILVVVGVVYRKELWPRPSPNFDTSCTSQDSPRISFHRPAMGRPVCSSMRSSQAST